ncbi:MAG TPA: phosphoglucosamine mutase, partial [Candidatus Butyricicoccus avistercoris]|nr:phosphoglucosamine mutase [Candidatus Butyricicoccus avistercoris]
MGKYFGTDGVRGVANIELDAMLAFKIGAAAAYLLSQEQKQGGKAKLLIGKDTRISSDMLESA